MTTSALSGGGRIAAMSVIVACATRYHQPSAVSVATLTVTSARSWRRTRLVRSGGGADDPMTGKVEVCELPVFAVDLDLHRAARRAARGAADVRDFIFEAGGQNDLRARFLARDL